MGAGLHRAAALPARLVQLLAVELSLGELPCSCDRKWGISSRGQGWPLVVFTVSWDAPEKYYCVDKNPDVQCAAKRSLLVAMKAWWGTGSSLLLVRHRTYVLVYSEKYQKYPRRDVLGRILSSFRLGLGLLVRSRTSCQTLSLFRQRSLCCIISLPSHFRVPQMTVLCVVTVDFPQGWEEQGSTDISLPRHACGRHKGQE